MRILRQIVNPSFFVVMTALISTGPIAEVYKVVDQDGNIIYTDRPGADLDSASIEKLPPLNKMPALMPPDADKRLNALPEEQLDAFPGYGRGIILSPENDSIVPHNQTSILIQIGLNPQLNPGHVVQFLVDGVPQGSAVAAIAHRINNVERGTRSLSARVFDANGQLLITTPPVKVHVKRNFARK